MNYYYHPFFGPVFPTYQPPGASQYAPGEARVGNQTAEFTVSNNQTQTRFTGHVNLTEGVIKGTLSDLAHTQTLPATVSFKQQDLMNIQMKRINERDWVLLDQNGHSTGYQLKDYTVMQTAGGTYQVVTGTFIDPAGNKADLYIKTDSLRPAPSVVVLISICAATCVVLYTIQQLTTNCNNILKDNVAQCLKNKLRPVISVSFGLGITWNPLRFGCYPECKLDCLPIA